MRCALLFVAAAVFAASAGAEEPAFKAGWYNLMTFPEVKILSEAYDSKAACAAASTPSKDAITECSKLEKAGDDYARAIAFWTKVLNNEKSKGAIYGYRGILYKESKDYPRAVKDFTAAIKLMPDDATLYSMRGVSYKALGDKDRAIADFRTALTKKATPDVKQAIEDSLKDLGATP